MDIITWDREVLGKFLDKLEILEDRSKCWLWEGCVGNDGYGLIRVGGKIVYVHRLAYTIFVGEIPEGKCILHSCDVRNCCNPIHLWAGTNKENTRDMITKARNSSKLLARDIPKICRMLACGYPQRYTGKVFGISQSAINNINNGKAWNR